MKKWFLVSMLICIFLLTASACSSNIQPDKPTETTTQIHPTKDFEKTQTIVIDDGKYRYAIEKTNFEENYSEDLLMEILKLIPMEFGCDDYNNWEGTPNEILNDAFFSSDSWHMASIEYESDEWNAAVAELKENTHGKNLGEYTITDIEKINSYIKRIYGPNAREFVVEDFETYNEIKINDDSVFKNYDLNFRYAYLPKTDLIVRFANEICFGIGEACYVYDIETDGDTYIVRAVTGSEEIGENIFTFEGIQGDALNMLNTYTSGVLTDYTFTICNNKDGSLYMKSVERSYLIHDNAKMTYRVNVDTDVEIKKYYSGEWEVIDTISKDDEFFSNGHCYEKGYEWIITEEYIGRVEKKYLTPIE